MRNSINFRGEFIDENAGVRLRKPSNKGPKKSK